MIPGQLDLLKPYKKGAGKGHTYVHWTIFKFYPKILAQSFDSCNQYFSAILPICKTFA
jgi:hypothetical protein